MSDVKDSKYISYVQYRKNEILNPGAYVYVNNCPKDGYRKHNGTFGVEAGNYMYPIFKRVDALKDVEALYDKANGVMIDAVKLHLAFLQEHAPFQVGDWIEYGQMDYVGKVVSFKMDSGTPLSPCYVVETGMKNQHVVSTIEHNPRAYPESYPKPVLPYDTE